jgi:hypothetical protein
VHKLVPYYVSEFPHRAGVWNYNAPFDEFKKTSYTFRNHAGCYIRLLKVKMRTVKYKRYAVRYIVEKLLLKNFVTLLGKISSSLCKVFHFLIIIDIEVLGLQNMPIEVSVLDFIPAEVEELRRCRSCENC